MTKKSEKFYSTNAYVANDKHMSSSFTPMTYALTSTMISHRSY